MQRILPQVAIAAIICSGCGALGAFGGSAPAPAERATGYGYVPLDGLGLFEDYDASTCTAPDGDRAARVWRPILDALPDMSARFAVATVNGELGLSWGPVKVTSKGGLYKAVLDFINVTEVVVPFYVKKHIRKPDGSIEQRLIRTPLSTGEAISMYEARISYNPVGGDELVASGYELLAIPVYVGIGLRLSADILAMQGNVGLTGLTSIGVAAQSNMLAGTMTVQTMGVTGGNVISGIPIPSKLDGNRSVV